MNTLKINLLDDPKPIGFRLYDRGFIYELLDVQPHTTRLGERSLVTTWLGECAKDGEPFTFKSGAAIHNLPRRCREHAKGMTRSVVAPFRRYSPSDAHMDAAQTKPEDPELTKWKRYARTLETLVEELGGDLPEIDEASPNRTAVAGAVAPKPEMTEAEIAAVRNHLLAVARRAREERLAEIAAEQAALKPSPQDLLS
jgi:hypothetical protein